MNKTPETVDELFESVLITEDDVEDAVDDDMEDDELDLEYLEENRKISIFDSEFLLEGEMENVE